LIRSEYVLVDQRQHFAVPFAHEGCQFVDGFDYFSNRFITP
jgi:hypothetical protein